MIVLMYICIKEFLVEDKTQAVLSVSSGNYILFLFTYFCLFFKFSKLPRYNF